MGPTLTLRTRSAADTREVAASFAGFVDPGDVIALSGELGAGKTCFVQGLARGLRIDEPITSPTFVLVKSYRGRLPLVHVDVYRLGRLQDVLDLGDEVFAADVLTCVEWGDAIASLLPDDRLEVEILHADDAATTPPSDEAAEQPELTGDRLLRLTLHGDWADRRTQIETGLTRWRTEPSC